MTEDKDISAATVFDGHNDVLLKLYQSDRDFFARHEDGHIDLPRAREGRLGGGFCAIFVPPAQAPTPIPDGNDAGSGDLTLDLDLDAVTAPFKDEATMPPTPELGTAQRTAMAMMALLYRLEETSKGQIRLARTADEIASGLAAGGFTALMHLEGAEAIDPELNALEVFYRAGLRSLGPVWSRPNAFGHGVPFKFEHSPDTGPGLTGAGRELVRGCNRLGIMIDLSHLNEQGFWDVAHLTEVPLVATHSNAHALSPSTRNLTDKQLDAIKESDGMVGVNFHVGFLREDGESNPDTPLTTVVRHVDYLVERLGIDRVGFGSDFDGATMPRALGDAASLPRLITALHDAGYDDAAVRKLGHQNWLRVLRKTLHD